ncbi:hypothetical protein ACTNUZ_004191 [Enterobacter hormaechei]
MNKAKLSEVTGLISDFRDSAAEVAKAHLSIIEKLTNDAARILEKPLEQRSAEEVVIAKYYEENIHPIVEESIGSIGKYNEGTDKYIKALEMIINSLEKD